MENKLEQLLNSLIQRGWRPFGEGCHRSPYKRVGIHKNYNKERTYVLFYSNNHSHWKVLRQVVSKESGLWQFVCENKLTTLQIEYNNRKPPERGIRYHWNKHSNVMQEDERLTKERKRNENYEYRLIESALKDESELESFILDNIKV